MRWSPSPAYPPPWPPLAPLAEQPPCSPARLDPLALPPTRWKYSATVISLPAASFMNRSCSGSIGVQGASLVTARRRAECLRHERRDGHPLPVSLCEHAEPVAWGAHLEGRATADGADGLLERVVLGLDLDAFEGAVEDAHLHRGQAPTLHAANLLVPAGRGQPAWCGGCRCRVAGSFEGDAGTVQQAPRLKRQARPAASEAGGGFHSKHAASNQAPHEVGELPGLQHGGGGHVYVEGQPGLQGRQMSGSALAAAQRRGRNCSKRRCTLQQVPGLQPAGASASAGTQHVSPGRGAGSAGSPATPRRRRRWSAPAAARQQQPLRSQTAPAAAVCTTGQAAAGRLLFAKTSRQQQAGGGCPRSRRGRRRRGRWAGSPCCRRRGASARRPEPEGGSQGCGRV